MNGTVASPGVPAARSLRRLAFALVVSIALHGWFVWGVRVVAPRQHVDPGEIHMRLSFAASPPDVPAQPPQVAPVAEAPAVPDKGAPAALRQIAEPRAPPPQRVAPSDRPPSVQPPVPEAAVLDRPAAPATAPEPQSFGPALEMPQIEDPEFYPARQLDVLPRPLGDVALRYPAAAADQDLSGRVVLLLLIDELGMVVEANVISSDPPGVFDEAALESFRGIMFAPAQRHGRAVKSRLPVEVSFDARVGSMKP